MPIQSCQLPDGKSGYKWGDKGDCYAERAGAVKQAVAAYANGYVGDESEFQALRDEAWWFETGAENDGIALDYASVRTVDIDGRLRVEVSNISKCGVNPYWGREIPNGKELGLDPDRIYFVFRDPEELKKSVASFNGVPILSAHEYVSAENPHPELVIGSTGTEAVFEYPYLKNSLIIWSQADIDGIQSHRKKEVSSGYHFRAVAEPGKFEGQNYDLRMVDIIGNHVALVEEGRAGPDVVVGDSQFNRKGTTTMTKHVLSRKGLLVAGAVRTFLAPRLAQDASINLGELLADVKSATFAKQRAEIVARITQATHGKLAKNATLLGLDAAIDPKDDDIAEDDDDDETEAEKKKREEEGGRKANKKLDEERKTAEDEDDDKKKKDEEEGGRKANEKLDEERKTAMDAALKEVEVQTIQRMNAIRQAERDVRPHIGELSVAMDSAEAVYKLALDGAKIDTKGVPPSAYAAMVRMLPVPGQVKQKLAMDSSVMSEVSSFLKTATGA